MRLLEPGEVRQHKLNRSMSAATSIQKLRLMARESAFDYRKQDLLNAANDMEEMSLRIDEWRKTLMEKTPLEVVAYISATYHAGYKHGYAVGVEQGILTGSPTPDDEEGFTQPKGTRNPK